MNLWLASSGPAELRAAAQDPGTLSEPGHWLIKTWTAEDGLPGNDVTAITQTPDGYLWLGTFDGLVRFDGMKFTVFDRLHTPELPSNAVVNLHLDQQGVLWISTDRGMVAFKEGRWRTCQGWTGDYVRTFAEGAGKLFATLSNCPSRQASREKAISGTSTRKAAFGCFKEGTLAIWREITGAQRLNGLCLILNRLWLVLHGMADSGFIIMGAWKSFTRARWSNELMCPGPSLLTGA
jgi:hypothetical protein